LARAFAKAKNGYFSSEPGEGPSDWQEWLRRVRAEANTLAEKLFIDDQATWPLRESLMRATAAADIVLHSLGAGGIATVSPGETLLADEIERTQGPIWPRAES
jgi:hypothetical protein